MTDRLNAVWFLVEGKSREDSQMFEGFPATFLAV